LRKPRLTQGCSTKRKVGRKDSETSTEKEKSSKTESSGDKTSDLWCKTDEIPSSEPFLGTTGLKYRNQYSTVQLLPSNVA